MLNNYQCEVDELSEMYKQASELVMMYETFNKIGNLSFTYQLKDAFSHLMNAIEADKRLALTTNSAQIAIYDKEIREELGACRGHLFRLIMDAGELFSLKVLDQVIKIYDRTPKAFVSKIYPNLNSTIRPQYLNYLSQIEALKLQKAHSSQKSLSDAMYNLALQIKSYSTTSLQKQTGYKWYVCWTIVGWTVSVALSGVVGALISLAFK